MSLRVYNTLSRQKEMFATVHPGKVGIYLCGPTVYKPPHIGHMVGPVIFDAIKRYLKYKGYEVTWVVNITDVDDKIIEAAARQQVQVQELSDKYTAEYLDCLNQFGIDSIDRFPKASEHMHEIIELVPEADRPWICLRCRRERLVRSGQGPRLRKALQSQSRGAGIGSARTRRAGEEERGGFRTVENRQGGRAGVGFTLGEGAARLAYRMLGDEPEIPRRNPRYPRRRHGPHVPPS